MEFHIHASIRSSLGVSTALFRTTGNLVIPDFSAARNLAAKIRALGTMNGQDTSKLSAGRLNAMGLIDEILHIVLRIYRERVLPGILGQLASRVSDEIGPVEYKALLKEFCSQFPPREVYQGLTSIDDWLESRSSPSSGTANVPNKDLAFEELILLKLANENPAFGPFRFLFDDGLRPAETTPDSISRKTQYRHAFEAIERASLELPPFGPAGESASLMDLLRMPARAAPDSLESQLLWIREHWGASFDEIGLRILQSLDLIKEEETPRFPPGPGPILPYKYSASRNEYEKFTQDKDWMPSLVLVAKNSLVWLHQLSEVYGTKIIRLDQIPDRELDSLAARGINGLWLIGIWQRSPASEKIKRLCGNPEAAASAYSLFDYEIAPELGGWEALDNLRERCLWRGIRLAADMVPNHTGIDSAWVRTRPDLFIGSDHCPFPGYSFNGPDLSGDPSMGIWLEDHYYSKTDAAVVFKRLDRRNGKVRYIYHGNDGTGMAWNDTAQIDFLNPEARDAVRERILHVARHFSIIRFDAAMVLARQHIRRLWYPAPGSGGAIPSRAEHSMGEESFDKAMPHEFWREVVDECAEKAPDTLLLAEAFWMMEGYFTRTLGMHRVYNSAFMNMLKDEKNSLYRLTIRNTQEFDKQILKRFVNFMSNPDEETAIAQFGSGDKYFGVCTMMATMPGLPMFGHGQIEGLTEKYGMEYRRSYRDEKPDEALVARHEREIFPLLRMRKLFAEVDNFCLFDFLSGNHHVDENVFAYSNGLGEQRALVFYNNHWERSSGKIYASCAYSEKNPDGTKHMRTKTLVQALDLDPGPGNYLAAFELKSGLWYIHRCSDLNLEGWQVSLEGYQTLVFTEFSRVHDSDGSFERLMISLKGKGIADLDEGLEEAARPELYHALGTTILAIRECALALSEKREEEVAFAAERAGEQAELFFSRLAQAIAEDGGPNPGIVAVSKGRTIIENGIAMLAALQFKSRGEVSADEDELRVIAQFRSVMNSERGLHALLHYIFIFGLSRMNAGANQSEELRYLLEKFLVKKKLQEESTTSQIRKAETSGAVSGAVEASLARIDDAAAYSLAFAFATRPRDTALRPSAAAPKKQGSFPSLPRERAAELVRWAGNDHEAREALGINSWEGVDYFNKEKYEALLELWPCFALLEEALFSLDASRSRQKPVVTPRLFGASSSQIFEMRDIAFKAEERSEFKVSDLIAAIKE
ncbi:MAG TPA: alpha-amylase family glycosyl hydrolase [Rectinemataceae bacterium]|nr:alpha-amylase family glycosyl hydrolase [Rectinemataceae bacterium]